METAKNVGKNSLTIYFEQISENALLTKDEEQELFRALEKAIAEKSNEEAAIKEKITEANLLLVVKIAMTIQQKRKLHADILQDMIQEGNLGLLRAIERFDYKKGWKFSTYATWWIYQRVTRFLSDNMGTIRVPVHMQEYLNNTETYTSLSPARQALIKKARNARNIARLDEPSTLNKNISRHEFQQIPAAPFDEKSNSKIECERMIEKTVGLTKRERIVIEMRYGVKDGECYILADIGNQLGITRERVRQIEESALKKICKAMRIS